MTKSKIFVISLHRTMTRSTDILLSSLGYTTLHFPKFFNGENLMEAVRGLEDNPERVLQRLTPLIVSRDAFSDVPFPGLYPQLAERWPDSRFILVHRDPDHWERSARGHMKDRKLSPYNRIQYRLYVDANIQRLPEIPKGRLAEIHEQHTHQVREYFDNYLGEADRLCTVDIADGNAGEQICAFLGHDPIPLPRLSGRPSPEDMKTSREWVEACPYKSDARYFLATNLLNVGRVGEAREHLRCAIQHEPDQPKPYAMLSEILERDNDREAEVMAHHAVRCGLIRPRLCSRAARGRARAGHWKEAFSLWMTGLTHRVRRH